MGPFFTFKNLLYMFLGAVSAVVFCFTKGPVMDFFYKVMAAQQINVTLIMMLLVVVQLAYAGCFMGLSALVVKVNVKDE